MRRNFVLALATLFLTVLVMGCNTMKGAGKDVEKVGQNIQKSADQKK